MVAALDRLRALPEVFSLRRVMATFDEPDVRRATRIASVYLDRWVRDGLVQAYGGRTGVYFNLIRNPQAPSQRRDEALRLVFPSAVLAGASVLHDAGVTTQIPHRIEVAVLRRKSYPNLPELELLPRPQAWFEAMRPYVLFQDGVGLPRLLPAAALADCWHRHGSSQTMWRPGADDLYAEEVDWRTFDHVLRDLGDPWPRGYEAFRPGSARHKMTA